MTIPFTTKRPEGEAHLLVETVTRRATSWCAKGHVVAWDQIALNDMVTAVPRPKRRRAIEVETCDTGIAAVMIDGETSSAVTFVAGSGAPRPTTTVWVRVG